MALVGVIYQDTDPELGEVTYLEGYHQKEGVRDFILGDDVSEDQGCRLKDLIWRHPYAFTDMPMCEEDLLRERNRNGSFTRTKNCAHVPGVYIGNQL